MKCPHCLVEFHDEWTNHNLDVDKYCSWHLSRTMCPACLRCVMRLSGRPKALAYAKDEVERIVYPKSIGRTPVPVEVPEQFAADYKEACLVLDDSPKASAALSRRCLQLLLREKMEVKGETLFDEIKQAIDSKELPSYVSTALDSVRKVGNIAAHPQGDEHTGEIVDVEPGEAEWQLETIEGMFDALFVQPARFEKNKEALDKKLAEAKKPEADDAADA